MAIDLRHEGVRRFEKDGERYSVRVFQGDYLSFWVESETRGLLDSGPIDPDHPWEAVCRMFPEAKDIETTKD